ncbi:MAG: hypothetical protein R3B07_15220 [Polyangiaceae bacterium]
MRCVGGLMVLLGVVGCASPPKNPPELAADTELACARSDAAAWTQIMFRTDTWRELAQRADAGDAAAFGEIADHMQAAIDAGDTACNPTRVERLRETAERLREAPRPSLPPAAGLPPKTDPDPGEVRRDDEGEAEPASDYVEPDADFAEAPAKPPGSASRVPTVRQTDGRVAVYRRVMRQAQTRFRGCYQGALNRQETIKAAVIEFVVAPDGHVEKTSFEGGTRYFDRCMDTTFKSLRFPEEAGRMIIRYPLNELPR